MCVHTNRGTALKLKHKGISQYPTPVGCRTAFASKHLLPSLSTARRCGKNQLQKRMRVQRAGIINAESWEIQKTSCTGAVFCFVGHSLCLSVFLWSGTILSSGCYQHACHAVRHASLVSMSLACRRTLRTNVLRCSKSATISLENMFIKCCHAKGLLNGPQELICKNTTQASSTLMPHQSRVRDT